MIELMELPRDTGYRPYVVASGGALRPGMGGPTLPTPRTGDKWGFEVNIRAMDALCGEALIVDLTRGAKALVRMRIDEPGMPAEDYGAARVNGSGHLGAVIPIKNARPGALIRKGKWLSLDIPGRSYLYKAAGPVTVGANGQALVPIEPMIRRAAADNVVVRLADPIIEGFVSLGNGWSRRRLGDHGITSVDFRIEEQA